jgi:5-methylcytosine-specific restriction endonuclease McrA
MSCQRCGKTGDRHTLTVHLNPALGGDHLAASRDDLTTLCRSCHGSIDAPRARTAPPAESTALRAVDRLNDEAARP